MASWSENQTRETISTRKNKGIHRPPRLAEKQMYYMLDDAEAQAIENDADYFPIDSEYLFKPGIDGAAVLTALLIGVLLWFFVFFLVFTLLTR